MYTVNTFIIHTMQQWTLVNVDLKVFQHENKLAYFLYLHLHFVHSLRFTKPNYERSIRHHKLLINLQQFLTWSKSKCLSFYLPKQRCDDAWEVQFSTNNKLLHNISKAQTQSLCDLPLSKFKAYKTNNDGVPSMVVGVGEGGEVENLLPMQVGFLL